MKASDDSGKPISIRRPASSGAKVASGRSLAALQSSSPTVDSVIQYILEGIAAGRFVPGQKLVEAELGRSLGLRRFAIREGLRMLAGKGVIVLTPNRGASIRRLEREDMCALIYVLAALDSANMALALELNARPALRATLTPILGDIQQAAKLRHYDLLLEQITRYHVAVQRMGRNEYMQYLWSQLQVEHFHRCLSLEVVVRDWDLYIESYEKSHAALIRGDLSGARDAIGMHSTRLMACLRQKQVPAIFLAETQQAPR